MELFLKKYKITLFIKKLFFSFIIFSIFTLMILIIVFAIYHYELDVIFSFIGILLALFIPFLIVLYVPNFYPSRSKYLKIFLSYRIYVLQDEKTIKKYRNNFVWQKIINNWDKELLAFDNDVEIWFNNWYLRNRKKIQTKNSDNK